MSKVANFAVFGANLLALSLVPAQAQDASAERAVDGGAIGQDSEIVVSARRREETVQDVPQTINVVTAAQVEKLNLRTFQDIQTIVPGLTLTQTNAFSNQATVRGVAYVPEASGYNPSVEFYLNDAPIASGFLFQSTYDFGQFELQRGPQGTLRGRASPSGSIAVTTRRPDLTQAGMVLNGTLTSQHAGKIDGAVNVPIIRDVFAVRVAGVVDDSRGSFTRSIKETTDPAHNEAPYKRTRSLRGSARLAPADWVEAQLMYQTLHTEGHRFDQIVSDSLITGGPSSTLLVKPSDRLSFDDQGGFDRQDNKILIGNLDFRFAGQKLSYVTAHTKQDFGSMGGGDKADLIGSPLLTVTPRTLSDPTGYEPVCQNEARKAAYTATTGAFFQCTHGWGKQHSHELRLASDSRIAGVFDYVIGAFYNKNTGGTNLTQQTPVLGVMPPPNVFVSLTPIERRQFSLEKSAFANLTAHLGQLELSGGVRVVKFRESSTLSVGGAKLDDTRSPSKHPVIYTGSAKYQLTPDFMVYAQTGSSWRPGPRAVGNFSLAKSEREIQFTDLPDERSKSYEIGVKTRFLDGRGHFNISGFYQKFKNYPYRGQAIPYVNYGFVQGTGVVPSVATFNFLAAAPVTVKGVEADASLRILDRWSISANAAYADGKIKNGTVACLDLNRDGVPDANGGTPKLADLQAALEAGQNVAACSGINRRSLNSPKFSANVQSEYSVDIGRTTEGFVRGSASFYGKTSNDPDNSFDSVGAYTLLNLYAGLRDPDGQWEVMLFGKNILRTREVLSYDGSGLVAMSIRTPALTTLTSQYRGITAMTAPREFGVSARIALGSR